ncbi:SDR family oxidoreductase [Salicibibacter cibarius]|uniref:SDR family oxidoreductase n=1 Tax=Salicibibacter cibarius TaxID=2743000 RepID=A0A7T6Z693_9BACI|nr:SDR family NAD(P)-dependent oxidoreductase [Salicibibacter cibarius]QQK77773.1 SDR family oxidoreductase [Salicibibacter cibarius]
MKLKDQIAAITGAGRGIGRAIALKLAQEGANIVVSDIDLELAEKTVTEIYEIGSKAVAHKVDVCNYDEMNQLGEKALTAFDRPLEIMINNAGITQAKNIFDITPDEWDLMLNIHLRGSFFGMQMAGKIMKKTGKGSIVNMASVYGREGHPLTAHYSASKAGIIDLTKSFAKALAPSEIRVNSVAPSVVETDLWDLGDAQMSKLKGLKKGQAKEERLKQIPLGRSAKPEDIANTVSFLVSKDAEFITGECVHVTGGALMV